MAEREEGKERRAGSGKEAQNDVSHLSEDDFTEAFHKRFFPYQRELLETASTGTAFSSSPGCRLYMVFRTGSLKTPASGDRFLVGNRAQSGFQVVAIVDLAKEAFGIELKGTRWCCTRRTEQPPSPQQQQPERPELSWTVYIDEAFWVQGFNKLYKVATGMAAHKKWRRTLLSTPSAVTHEAL